MNYLKFVLKCSVFFLSRFVSDTVFLQVPDNSEDIYSAPVTMTDPLSSSDVKKSRDGRFVCDCGKLYKRKSDRARHQREE